MPFTHSNHVSVDSDDGRAGIYFPDDMYHYQNAGSTNDEWLGVEREGAEQMKKWLADQEFENAMQLTHRPSPDGDPVLTLRTFPNACCPEQHSKLEDYTRSLRMSEPTTLCHLERSTYEAFQRVLESCADTLEVLVLCWWPHEELFVAIDFPSLPQLHSLAVCQNGLNQQLCRASRQDYTYPAHLLPALRRSYVFTHRTNGEGEGLFSNFIRPSPFFGLLKWQIVIGKTTYLLILLVLNSMMSRQNIRSIAQDFEVIQKHAWLATLV